MSTVEFPAVNAKMLENRVVTICTEIEPIMADLVMKQLLYLAEESAKPIQLYINSPGGQVRAGLQIIDTMNAIRCEVHTYNTGLCASMGAVILSSGAKRMMYPHASIMIHQVSSGTQGKVFDMKAAFEETVRINNETMAMLAENCGKTLEELIADTPVDKYLTPQQALEYGIIDEVIGNAHRKVAKKAGVWRQ